MDLRVNPSRFRRPKSLLSKPADPGRRGASPGLALEATSGAIAHLRQNIGLLIVANVLTVIAVAPFTLIAAIVPVFPQSRALTLIAFWAVGAFTPVPAAAGLHTALSKLSRDEHLFASDVWDGLKLNFGFALRTWIIAAAGVLIILANLTYYPRTHLALALFLEIVWLYLLVMWLAIHLYVYPLIVRQEVRSVRLVYRNALHLVMRNPLFTGACVILWAGAFLLVSVTGLVVVIGLAFCISFQHSATQRLLARQTEVGTRPVEAPDAA